MYHLAPALARLPAAWQTVLQQPAMAANLQQLDAKLAERAAMPASARGAERLGGVLHHGDAPFPAKLHELVHVAGMPEGVHGNDGGDAFPGFPVDAAAGCTLRMFLQKRFKRPRTEAERVPVDVDKHRRRLVVGDGVGGGDEGQRLGEDLVPRPDARQAQGRLKGGGAGDGDHRAAEVHIGAQLLLKAVDIGADAGDKLFDQGGVRHGATPEKSLTTATRRARRGD